MDSIWHTNTQGKVSGARFVTGDFNGPTWRLYTLETWSVDRIIELFTYRKGFGVQVVYSSR
jgi:hypothetical protein